MGFSNQNSAHLDTSKSCETLEMLSSNMTTGLQRASAWRSAVTTCRRPRRLSVTMDHLRMPAVFTVTVNTPGGHSPLANTTRGAVALFKATRVTGAPRGAGGGQNARVTRRRGRPAPKLRIATCLPRSTLEGASFDPFVATTKSIAY